MTEYKVTVTTVVEIDFEISAETEREAATKALKEIGERLTENILEERFVTKKETVVEHMATGKKYKVKGNRISLL